MGSSSPWTRNVRALGLRGFQWSEAARKVRWEGMGDKGRLGVMVFFVGGGGESVSFQKGENGSRVDMELHIL